MSCIIKTMRVGFSLRAPPYEVATPHYQGPLDLLLNLIETAKLDITRLALAQVTDQFIEHLNRLDERSAEEVSSFLVIAAKLLQIKSEALLPRPPEREEGEEDPGESLARQLLIYKRFKKVADALEEREESGYRTYVRLAQSPKVEGKVDLDGIGLVDLMLVAKNILSMAKEIDLRPSLSSLVTAPKFTIRQKISAITSLLRNRGRANFGSLLNEHDTRLEIVVTFLAVLELVKLHLVRAYQQRLFGEIELEKDGSWKEAEEFDLEFGE